MQGHERGVRSDVLCNILPMQVSRGCCPFSDVYVNLALWIANFSSCFKGSGRFSRMFLALSYNNGLICRG